jgi:hypothetical protein
MISNTIKLKGLYTFGNELNQPEGSLTIADNVNIDEPNVVTQRRGFDDYADLITPSSTRIRQLMQYKDVLFRTYSDKIEFYNSSTDSFSQFDGSYLELDPTVRMKYAEANSNFYFTTSESIKKISAESATEFSTSVGYIKNAGVPAALDTSASIVYTNSGFLPPESKVAYKVLFGQKDNNNNLLLGTPSARYILTNQSKDVFSYEKTFLIYKNNENFNAQVSILTCSTKNNTNETNISNPDSVILLSNADNFNQYAIWFNKGVSGIAPVLAGYTNIEVDLSLLGTSDPVATTVYNAIITYGLTNITTTINGNDIRFTNIREGAADPLNTPNTNFISDVGGGWAGSELVLGTSSNYIEKYFTLFTPDADYCFYYGNDRTIGTIPSEISLAGFTFVGIDITNASTKSSIANKTASSLQSNVGSSFLIDLDVSVANPIITLTDQTGGNLQDITSGDILIANLEVSISSQGSISEGQNANVNVSFTVPTGINTDYFYQIYRTGYVTVTEGLTLSDIDPGEELNLVYEGSVNLPSGSTITVLDITNETFRNSGGPLYNNSISGEGVLQSNDIPPVAKDLCIYKNSMFYANTKITHQQSIAATSIDGFTTSTTKIRILNNTIEKVYTFHGTATEHTITCGTKADTLVHKLANPDSKIYLYSAPDSTKYVVYFDDGTGTTPNDTDATPIRVDISELSSGDLVTDAFLFAISQFSDFEVTKPTASTLKFINNENGTSITFTTPNNNIVTDIGIGYNINLDAAGTGEDLLLGHILLSKSASIGLKLERTIRSLVAVLNADSTGIVNAYYISSLNDLPGKFLIKSRSSEDINFYFTIIDGLGSNFNPEIPSIDSTEPFTAISAISPTVTELTLVDHGFVNNEEVYINIPNASPVINGVFKVTVLTTDTISIVNNFTSGNTTDSYYFFPFEKSDNLSSPNRVMYSKISQPEAVPLINYIDIGTKDQPIERILALRDYLFVIKTDGIYIVSGFYGQYSVEQLDTEKILCPDSAVVLNNQIYMLTNNGVITVNESSPMIISRMIENKFLATTKYRNLVRSQGFGVSYNDDRAYLLWIPSSEVDDTSTQCFRYNILEKTWTRWTKTASAGTVIDTGTSKMYIADGDRPIIMEERKNLDRTDFSDKRISLELGAQAITVDRYGLSTVSEIEIGDVISQTQYLNYSEYNRFLQKLDLDPGLLFYTFYNDYICNEGDNIYTKVTLLNAKLQELDTSGNVTIHAFNNSDWIASRNLFNLMISQLNIANTVTSFKNYKESTDTVEFEYIITNVYPSTNEVMISDSTEFIQGSINLYKHIKTVIQLNPITFGEPTNFKQISKGYLIFDQNNFYRMLLEYATDLSPSFIGREFRGRGAGFWGSSTWGFEDRNYWGGDGSDAPRRVIIPKNKQRCRYITVRITHTIARDTYRIVGVAHDVRSFSSRAYK